MSLLENPFSWSYKRHSLFYGCHRRYYFSFYAAWGGWLPDAPARVRELYMLKRLCTRQHWTAQHMHQAIDQLLVHAKDDPTGEIAAHIQARQLDRMRVEFRDSREKSYIRNIKSHGLFEHEYQIEVLPVDWKTTVEHMSTAVQKFLASDIWQELKQAGDPVVPIGHRIHFMLNGLKVVATPDVVIRRDGKIILYDWKMGDTPLSEHRTPMGIYALLALEQQWIQSPAELTAIVYNPATEQRETFFYTDGDLETFREFILDSADEMMHPLDNPKTNDAGDGRHFDCTPDPTVCQTCSFLRACPLWASPHFT